MKYIVLCLLILAACQTVPDNTQEQVQPTEVDLASESFDPRAELGAIQFETEKEVEEFISEHSSSSYGRGVPLAVDVSFETTSMAKGADFSQTNNQVANVDEGDIIKTDGEYIYTITGNDLFIIEAYPGADAKIVSTIDLDSQYGSSLFINGDTLVVFGNTNNYDLFSGLGFAPVNGMTFFNVYDISDKEDPQLTKEFMFEGSYFNSRMIDEHIYVVTRSTPYAISPLPVLFEDGLKRFVESASIWYLPLPYQNPQFVTVNAVQLSDFEHTSKTIAVDGYGTLYMSENNMYVTSTEYINEWEIEQDVTRELVSKELSEEDKELINRILEVDSDILTQAEKDTKIYQIVTSYMQFLSTEEAEVLNKEILAAVEEKLKEYEYFEYTVITKLSVDGGDIEAVGSATIPGNLHNQFAMDEFDGVLRVASTVNARWSRYAEEQTLSTNHVFTLDSNMNELDHVGEIAEGERIFSTRFVDDKLYMVTFRQIDPFFVVDLSDPEQIDILGELKIPGFSRYLHPYDENTIIGIGHDADENGRQLGLKISLFDVSDVTNPQEVDQFITDERYANSVAEYEHKAFLFSKDKNLLVIPVYSYDYEARDSYNGAFVFDVQEDSVAIRGLIDHSTGVTWSSSVERSLYIEELLYTKSPYLLRIHEIDDLTAVKDVDLDTIPVY